MPMFPLGTVLFPHMVLPLHVFEPRYRLLVRDVLAGDGEFGVPLIERGHEVGGGDQRVDWGTVARVVKAEPLPDGRWILIAVGDRRFAVDAWLPDDPYPVAEMHDWDEGVAGPDAAALRAEVERRLRRVLALQAELGEEPAAPATIELEEDPLVASYQAATLAPVGPIDALALLKAETPDQRLSHLATLLDEVEESLSFRLRGA